MTHQAERVSLGRLTLEDVVQVARKLTPVADLSADMVAAIKESLAEVEAAIESITTAGETDKIYSINTGFGAQAGKDSFKQEFDTRVLSRNLIVSHSVGVGDYFDEETVRAAMLVRANSLSKGFSGVRPLIIEKLLAMLNKRVYPAVPSRGSLGASGDLGPLSHLVLMMTKPPDIPEQEHNAVIMDERTGEAFIPCEKDEFDDDPTYHLTTERHTGEQTLWQRVSGQEAMQVVDGAVELQAKEGLALNNGATFSAAIAALTLYDALNLLENTEVALSMTLEGILGFRDPFLPEVHQARPHPGAQTSAANILRYVEDSTLLDGSRHVRPRRTPPQDPYSVRCAPQVLGSVRDTLEFIRRTIEVELNAATDNPLIITALERDYKFVSCGNFHGEPIAMAMDFLSIAITELGSIAERRIFKLTDYRVSDKDFYESHNLPAFLIEEPGGRQGMNSGMMLTQYTAASLVSECKTLAHPDSVDSIPSSANQEDHVSMSLNAALHARHVVDNIEAVVAIEFLCAAQSLYLREAQAKRHGHTIKFGLGTEPVVRRIQKEIEPLTYDRVLYPDIRAMLKLVRSGELVQLAKEAAG